MVRDALKNFIPRNPIDRRYALAGDLSNIFRLQKGRMRITWIASSRQRKVCILFVSETLRKAGDTNDPYAIFARLVMSGQYNEFFQMLGVKPPTRVVSSPPMPSIH
jgi:mRNA-degrading endonuclease RelE of RelBE toxin-antitoxin system